MPIVRCTEQKRQTLEEFYKEMGDDKSNPVWKTRSDNMLGFLKMINENFIETKIWGLTSHDRLVLLTGDSSESDWYVIVSNIGNSEYYFDYKVPEDKLPWPYATMRGVANSLTQAKKYLAIAMQESDGWKNNKEVNKLLNEETAGA
jgi:hypothetical protein